VDVTHHRDKVTNNRVTQLFQYLDHDHNLLQQLLNDRPMRATSHQDNGDNTLPLETAPLPNCPDPNSDAKYWKLRCLAIESPLHWHNIPLPLTSPTPTTSVTPPPKTMDRTTHHTNTIPQIQDEQGKAHTQDPKHNEETLPPPRRHY
jgi:hypothetical protein